MSSSFFPNVQNGVCAMQAMNWTNGEEERWGGKKTGSDDTDNENNNTENEKLQSIL